MPNGEITCWFIIQQALRDKSNELEIKIDKEINALKAAVELTKNETIK